MSDRTLYLCTTVKYAYCTVGHLVVIPSKVDHCPLCYNLDFSPIIEQLKEEE